MKEATGEASMTLITVVCVGAVLTGLTVIISFLLTRQSNITKCENAGHEFYDGACHDAAGNIVNP